MVLAVVCFIPGAILLIASFFAFFSNQGTVGAVMLALALLFLLYGVYRIRKVKKSGGKSTSSSKRFIVKCYGVALYGLPQGVCECLLSLFGDRVVFTVNKKDSVLKAEKITSALLKTNSELKGASAGSTVAGALLFGVPGAIIASRPKNVTEYVIIINYTSDGELKTVAVAVNKDKKYEADKIVNYINKHMSGGSDTVL